MLIDYGKETLRINAFFALPRLCCQDDFDFTSSKVGEFIPYPQAPTGGNDSVTRLGSHQLKNVSRQTEIYEL